MFWGALCDKFKDGVHIRVRAVWNLLPKALKLYKEPWRGVL